MTMRNSNTKSPASLRAGLAGSSASGRGVKAGAAIGLSAAMLIPAHALAQQQEPEGPVAELATVEVVDTAIDPNPNAQLGVPYKARTSGDERYRRPLAETPQTITVLTKEAIDDSGDTDLSRILDAQPGITLGTGENGNAFGDRYVIRGQEARSDVFVDGMRDPGMTIRESFAVEQLEISKGPNSSFAGRGSSGGAINSITKQANTAYDFTRTAVGVGSDDYLRAAIDINHSFGDKFAVRANVLYSDQGVPDRAPASRERKGLALSGLYTPSENLEVTLDYYGLRAHDLPDTGSYLVGGKPAANVPPFSQVEDFLESDVDTGTARVKYRFSDNIRLTNLLRYGKSLNSYVLTGAHSATTGPNGPGGAYPTGTFSVHNGWQDVEYVADQTNLFVDTTLLGKTNNLVLGVEYTDHKVLNGVYTNTGNTGAPNCVTGNGTVLNNFCAIGPDGQAVAGLSTLLKRKPIKGNYDQDWSVTTISAYVMDTVDLTENLTALGSLRLDSFDLDYNQPAFATPYAYSDDLVNGYVALTYKVKGGGIFYGTVATATDINGGESDVGTNGGYGGLIPYQGNAAQAKPERSVNLEVGTKWNLFDESLLFTAAAFDSTKSDVMEGIDYGTAGGTFNTGKNRVRGLEFGLSGNMTEKLTVQAGVAYMHSRVLESFTPANVGKSVSNFANTSGVVQLRYQFNDDVYFGGAVKYEGRRFGGQPDTAAVFNAALGTYTQVVPAYFTVDLFGAYQVNKNLELRLNVTNLADKDYYQAVYRGGFFLYKGDARAARLTFNYEF